MKNSVSVKISICLLFVLFILILPIISSSNIGVSPATTYFKDVLRGGYAEKIVTITIDSEQPTKVNLEARGDIADWISFDKQEFEVSRDKPYYLKVIMQPPIDMPNGNYSGFLRMTTANKGENIEGHATGIVNAALDLYLEVNITDLEYSFCKASNFEVQSAEKGDEVVFKINILNEGNVRLYPTTQIEIWDQERLNVLKRLEFSEDMIIPTTEKEIVINANLDDLEIGQYWVEVTSVECYSSEILTFDILEEGALRAQGSLISITSPPWIYVDDTTLIEALFENTGEKNVNARFKGEITLGNKIVQILESESSNVEIGKVGNFKFYFTPRKEGKYIVTGVVLYDGKRTFEKSTVINVEENKKLFNIVKNIGIYLVLIIIIAYLAYKIKEEQKKEKRRRII